MTDQERITALEARIAMLEARLNAAEQRRAPMPALPALPTIQPTWPNQPWPGYRYGDVWCATSEARPV